MAVGMDARSRSLYLHAKPLVHHMNRNKDNSHWVSGCVFVNEGHVWCSYCVFMNKYKKKLFRTRDLNPPEVDTEHMYIVTQMDGIDVNCEL